MMHTMYIIYMMCTRSDVGGRVLNPSLDGWEYDILTEKLFLEIHFAI